MKKIIFDLDNTLIFWKDEYIKPLYDILEQFNIYNKELADLVNFYIESYESNYNYLTKENLISHINKNCHTNLDVGFLDALLKAQEFCFSKASDELISTLEYLSGKYELYVLSNWFTDCQIGRLKNAGIYKYFKKVVGGEGYMKPHPDVFLKVLKKEEFKDAIMIGDNLDVDIKGAMNVGISSILYNYKDKDVKKDGFKIIKTMSELKEIL